MTSTTTQKTALILGATGATGKEILKNLLSNPSYTSIHSFGRRDPLSLPEFSSSDSKESSSEKFHHTSIDFDSLSTSAELQSKLKQVKADVVFVSLGAFRKDLNSWEEWKKIDRDFVVEGAKAARNEEVKEQRVLYCSSVGANPNGWVLYPRSKGLTEMALANLGYSETLIFRPALLQTPKGREKGRWMEDLVNPFFRLASCVTDSVAIPVSTLGAAFAKAGLVGVEELEKEKIGQWHEAKAKNETTKEMEKAKFWLLSNGDSLKLGKEAS